MTSNPNSPTRPALGLGHHAPDHRALRSSCGLGRGGGFWNLQSTDRCSAKTDRSPAKSSFCLADMSGSRGAIFSSCVILASCTSLSPSGSSPIASWSGKHSIEDAVDCVKRALDDNYRSPRPLIPSVTHHVDTVEQGRVYDVSPQLGPYHVRVKSNGPGSTAVELFMPVTMYNAPLRDALAKCP
jgi:hypothetical protein